MGGSEGSGIPLSPGAWSSRKGLSNAYTNPSISGSGSGFLGSTAINSPNNSGKITLPAFPRGSLKRKKSVPSYDRHGSGIVISQDELETYDSGILELEYIEEEEKGRASSENGREDNGSKGGMFEKDDKVEKEIELRRASAVIKALEEDQGKDLEKGESENDIENEKQGEFFR